MEEAIRPQAIGHRLKMNRRDFIAGCAAVVTAQMFKVPLVRSAALSNPNASDFPGLKQGTPYWYGADFLALQPTEVKECALVITRPWLFCEPGIFSDGQALVGFSFNGKATSKITSAVLDGWILPEPILLEPNDVLTITAENVESTPIDCGVLMGFELRAKSQEPKAGSHG